MCYVAGMAIEVGKKAPAFTLESSDGGKVRLSDLAGRASAPDQKRQT
jgi:peroxiredoxin